MSEYKLSRIMRLSLGAAAVSLSISTATLPAHAQDKQGGKQETPQSKPEQQQESQQVSPQEAEYRAAIEALEKAAVAGPKDVPLVNQAIMHLPEGYTFVPQPEAGKFSAAIGNSHDQDLAGLVMSGNGGQWLGYLKYYGDGHVADDDAKTWNPDDMLQSLKDGTEAANAERTQRGFPALEVAGWIEKPAYDAATHRLVWSALGRVKGDANAEGSANYNTYLLGRDGHFELNLVTAASKVEGFKGDAKTLLAALEFNKGRSYADFDPKTDNMAAYGIAALVGGVAAKKLGLLALAAGLFAKFFKLIAIGLVAVGAAVKSFFAKRGGGGAQ